jgi:hypothetical protein
MKYAPKLLLQEERLAFNVARRTIILLSGGEILNEQLLMRSEAHLFHMLYLSYPDYVRDEDMSGALLVDDPETYYQRRLAGASPLQVETPVERGLIGLRKKLRGFGLNVGRFFRTGYYLCKDGQLQHISL